MIAFLLLFLSEGNPVVMKQEAGFCLCDEAGFHNTW